MNANLRNGVFTSLARLLDEQRTGLLEANRADAAACPPGDDVILDRLKLDDKKIDRMISSVRTVLAADDPVDKVISSHTRPDGLRIENRRVPFGTVLIIFEARPDVCIEAAIIALKAGNRILLKGGKEARNTNLFLADLWRQALEENQGATQTVRYLDISREETRELIRGECEKFDIVVPRGGEALIDFVVTNSSSPVIVSGRGNNFLYVDRDADFEMALKIALNGKQRLSVCNALDKILIDSALPDIETRMRRFVEAFRAAGIEVFGDETVRAIVASVCPVESEEIWYEEFLSAKLVVGIIADLGEAIETINKYSGGHSVAIITNDPEKAELFLSEVDCAAVYHNASIRFTDGGEFGLGAEIAISTQKLHFRGPLGAEHLMTNKWFVFGNGQIRE